MHRAEFDRIVRKCKLREHVLAEEEVAFTLYNEALAEVEREGCPRVGVATDRRAMLHLGETFADDNVATIMCFICGCKHIRHNGYDKFGRKARKGGIDYRTEEREALHRILTQVGKGKSWEQNLSYKRFKDRFGQAVSTDAHLQEGCFEWTRRVVRGGKIEQVICCPEDVRASSKCEHDS